MKTYRLTHIFNIIILIFTTNTASLATPCDATQQHPCIVIDTIGNPSELENWRDSKMISETFNGNILGLSRLWMSGSAAPSKAGFSTIINTILKQENSVQHILDIDLRQEVHGYLNGDAINLTTKHNWVSSGKTDNEIFDIENQWITTLAEQKIITNILTHDQFKKSVYINGMTIAAISVEHERDIVKNIGIDYERLTITDHMKPSDEGVDRFINIVTTLAPATWVHFHCRGGDGRTATFMAMYDMLNNADKVSFADIIKRQASAPPYYDLSVTNRKDSTLTVYYVERYEFLKHFYQFSEDYIHGNAKSWIEWKKAKGLH